MSSQECKSSSSSSSPLWSKSINLSTAALLVPLLLLGYDKWQQLGPFDLGQIGLAPTHRQAPVNNRTSSFNSTFSDVNKFETMAIQYREACPHHTYQTRLFSGDPLIMYIENFVTQDEAKYLLNLAEPYYMQSPLSGPEGRSYNAEVRKSVSAVVPNDAVVSCIRQRSADFQGLIPEGHVEDIQLVKYGTSDHFRPHYDWHPGMVNQRISTFFVYLACDDGQGGPCEGGETGFPNLDALFPTEWCQRGFVNCEKSIGEFGGAVFSPIVGNAVFWHNFYPNGTGVTGVYHAGLPVRKGRKVGLNIFSRKSEYYGELLRITDWNTLSDEDKARCGKDVSEENPCMVEVL